MSDSVIYKLSDHVTCRATNTELRMLFDREKGVMYELNESASAIVYALSDAPQSHASLVERLQCEFEGDTGIDADVTDFLADFEKAGLVCRAQPET